VEENHNLPTLNNLQHFQQSITPSSFKVDLSFHYDLVETAANQQAYIREPLGL
jgi:hypothetical protein